MLRANSSLANSDAIAHRERMSDDFISVIGAGPAGLMAAELLTAKGHRVEIFDAMPSFGRKFLMAGKSGLNLTHTEKMELFAARYPEPDPRLLAFIKDFRPYEIVRWANRLGIETYAGTTGRVFPTMMKASPLLRAWLGRLQERGATLHTRHRWQGWNDEGALVFESPDGGVTRSPAATILALGGGSWRRLGTDGAWTTHLTERDVEISSFKRSNCGFLAEWSEYLLSRFEGEPIKSVRLKCGEHTTRGEFVITKRGIEGGGIYNLSALLRDEVLAHGSAVLLLDLAPDMNESAIAKRLAKPRGKQSFSNHLRKTVRLTGAKAALLREFGSSDSFDNPDKLAHLIKHLPLKITGTVPIDEAISTAGGVTWDALDQDLMLKKIPGVFCAGEMIEWDAPTGGYLLTACLGLGRGAGFGAHKWVTENAAG